MSKSKKPAATDKKQPPVYGNPEYSASEDIYAKGEKVDDEELDAEQGILPSKTKTLDEGLDVPGADLDDDDEAIGEEDEENNYYSLGGDDHNDLDEDKGE